MSQEFSLAHESWVHSLPATSWRSKLSESHVLRLRLRNVFASKLKRQKSRNCWSSAKIIQNRNCSEKNLKYLSRRFKGSRRFCTFHQYVIWYWIDLKVEWFGRLDDVCLEQVDTTRAIIMKGKALQVKLGQQKGKGSGVVVLGESANSLTSHKPRRTIMICA